MKNDNMNCNPPLHGITVIDFDSTLPGACAISVLMEMGAKVIRIKQPVNNASTVSNKSTHYFNQDDGVEVLYLNLKDYEGKSKAIELIASADVLIDGFRPGKMNSLGIGYSDVIKFNESIIYASISGYGQTGPDALMSGHDINYMAASGALALTATVVKSDGTDVSLSMPANGSPIPFSDVGGAMYAVSTILAALYQRQTIRVGQWLDISLAESLVHQMSVRFAAFQQKDIQGVSAQAQYLSKAAYGVFQCDDGKLVSIAALETKFFKAMVTVLGMHKFSDAYWNAPSNRAMFSDIINAEIQTRVAKMSSALLVDLLRDNDVPVMIVVDPDAVHATEQFVSRRLFIESESGYLPRFPVRLAGMDS